MLKRILALIRLLALLFWESLTGAARVAVMAFGPRSGLRSALIAVPIQLQSPTGIWVLSCLITLTPGTVTVDFNETDRTLLVHSMIITDSAELARAIREGFEESVREVWG